MYFLVFLLGLVVGSFLNAVIYRLPFDSAPVRGSEDPSGSRRQGKKSGDSAFRGRSYCPHCKHELAWYDLIPLISFLLLQGKCRYCREKISIQYPLVEISTALIFLLILYTQFLGFGEFSDFWYLKLLYLISFIHLLYLFGIASLLIVLFVYDLRHYILPDRVLFSAIGITFAYHIFLLIIGEWGLSIGSAVSFYNALLSAVGAALFFFSIFMLSKGRAMGFGDVKLALFMGLFLGWPNILVALGVAFFAGALVGVVLIFLKKKGMKSEIPFGPFLIGGTFAALFCGKLVVDWYLGLLLV